MSTSDTEDKMTRYTVLRTWAGTLRVLGGISMALASIGVVALAVDADGFWNTLGILLLGTPIALLLASWPLALGEALRAIADIGDATAPIEDDRITY
jgi:hypothetical protein